MLVCKENKTKQTNIDYRNEEAEKSIQIDDYGHLLNSLEGDDIYFMNAYDEV